jgi:ribosome biogenesis protein YTM1
MTTTATSSSLSSNGSINDGVVGGDVAQVAVRFVTSTCRYHVPDSTLSVPVTLARYGLSEIVNALTSEQRQQQHESDNGDAGTPTPFDFLIDGRFLRTDLATYLTQHKQASTESVITLEYVAAAPPPSSLPSRPHPDWISALNASHSLYIVTACYDKHVRVFNHNVSYIYKYI